MLPSLHLKYYHLLIDYHELCHPFPPPQDEGLGIRVGVTPITDGPLPKFVLGGMFFVPRVTVF